jgi:3-dehydroquinate synthase
MQESFEVVSSGGKYRVVCGQALVGAAIANSPDAIFLVDDVFALSLPIPRTRRITIEATEGSKSLESMPAHIAKLREFGANRSSQLIAIGGGVVQDIATFLASIYMRGIRWTYLPTTLLGMADSCIGGKSSINVLGYKNLVGNFYPPDEVLIDVDFVSSLDAEKVVGGLFEAAKICYARSYDEFLGYLSEKPSLQMSPVDLQRTIFRALRAKKWFIETDEFDQKERLLLNFGHTFGHAIEAGTSFAVSHGIAVGVGMLVATEYAKRKDWLGPIGTERIANLSSHVRSMLGIGEKSVSIPPECIKLDLVLEKFDNDKKHLSDVYRMVCPRRDGELEVVSEPRNDEVRHLIRLAYQEALMGIGWRTVAN